MTLEDFVNNVRTYLQDIKEYNVLLGNQEETVDQDIKLAINMELEYYNVTPPNRNVSFSITEFPAPYQLVKGASARVLLSLSNRHDRNNVQYNDGGIAVSEYDKGPAYKNSALAMLSEWREFVKSDKIQRNLDSFVDSYSPMGTSANYEL